MMNDEKLTDLLNENYENMIIDFYNNDKDRKLIFDYQLNHNHYYYKEIKLKLIEYYFLDKYQKSINDYFDKKYLLIDKIMRLIFGENDFGFSSLRFFKNRDEDDIDYYQNNLKNIYIDFIILY